MSVRDEGSSSGCPTSSPDGGGQLRDSRAQGCTGETQGGAGETRDSVKGCVSGGEIHNTPKALPLPPKTLPQEEPHPEGDRTLPPHEPCPGGNRTHQKSGPNPKEDLQKDQAPMENGTTNADCDSWTSSRTSAEVEGHMGTHRMASLSSAGEEEEDVLFDVKAVTQADGTPEGVVGGSHVTEGSPPRGGKEVKPTADGISVYGEALSSEHQNDPIGAMENGHSDGCEDGNCHGDSNDCRDNGSVSSEAGLEGRGGEEVVTKETNTGGSDPTSSR